MRLKTLRSACSRFGTILLAVIVITASLFFVSAGSARAANPPYTNWTEYPTNPVFDPTEKVYYPSILFDGTTYRLWYDDSTTTRYATSTDGINWAPGTLTTGLKLNNARHAHVEKVDTKYMVWYWDPSVSIYSINAIRTAESTDGINWNLDSPITQVGSTVVTGTWPGWNTGTYGVCDVFYNASGSATIVAPVDASTVWANKFVMYYDGTTGSYEDIGVAVSNDGKNWQGYNGGIAPVLTHGTSGAWDDVYTTFCTVLKIGGTYYMWYSGGKIASSEGIGYAQSSDGLVWTRDAGNPMMHYTDGVTWRSERTYTPMVIYDAAGFSGAGENANFKMWYSGLASGNYAMGYARITEPTATPTTVGGRVNPVNKTALLAPYLGAIAAAAGIIFISRQVLKRFRFVRVNNRK